MFAPEPLEVGQICTPKHMRRIVGARSLVHPVTDRHLFPWRRLGGALGADHKAVQRWHAEGIGLIVAALNRAAAPERRAG